MKKLKGADMDIDLLPNSDVEWEKDECPWNKAEGNDKHKCAVKGVSICKHFKGIEKPDVVLCEYEGEEDESPDH
jgi:hypothetical protein